MAKTISSTFSEDLYTLNQAIQFFSLSSSDSFVAKKLWKENDTHSIKMWENKFSQKGLKINK